MFLSHGDPRHELSQSVGWVAVGEGDEGSGEPVVRVDAGQLAVLDEGGDHRPIVAAFVRPGKECVLPVQSDRSDRSLDGVRVELDTVIVEEVGETISAAQRVAERLGQLALGH